MTLFVKLWASRRIVVKILSGKEALYKAKKDALNVLQSVSKSLLSLLNVIISKSYRVFLS